MKIAIFTFVFMAILCALPLIERSFNVVIISTNSWTVVGYKMAVCLYASAVGFISGYLTKKWSK